MTDRILEAGHPVCCFRGLSNEFKGIVRRHVSNATGRGYWVRIASVDLTSIADVYVPAEHADRIRPEDWHDDDG